MTTWPFPSPACWENTIILTYDCDNILNTWIPDTWIPGTREEERARHEYLATVYQHIESLSAQDALERERIINNRAARQTRSLKNRFLGLFWALFPCL
jgi:hypothetical protein